MFDDLTHRPCDDDNTPGTWWPDRPALIDLHDTRVELIDATDRHGTERADDHALGWSMIVPFVAAGLLAMASHRTLTWSAPTALAVVFTLWLRAVSSGIWLSRSGIRAVSFPRRITVPWGHLHVDTRPALGGRRIVVSDDDGHKVALSMTQLASGYVFGRSTEWKDTALAVLASQLSRFDDALE